MVVRKFYLILLALFAFQGTFLPAFREAALTSQERLLRSLQSKKKKNELLSPTEALFVSYCLTRKEEIKKYAFDQFAKNIALVEHEMGKKGYVTFAHGRRWEWNFLNDVWNLICAISNDQSVMSDKISLRQRDKGSDSQALYVMRKDLVENGSSSFVYSSSDEQDKNAELTFMSRTLLSGGAYTAGCYLFEDTNWAKSSACDFVKKLLEKYKLQDYEVEIKNLFELHKASNRYGELLAISVKKSCLSDMVYKAHDGGFKDKNCKDVLKYIEKTAKDVEENKNYLEDEFNIYCFAVTDIPEEDSTMYSIQSIHLADQKKYQDYKKELRLLFEKIKKDRSTVID